MRLRPENQCDFYKTGHYRMYPEKTEMIYSNFTCRSSRHFEALPDFDGKVVNFGLQGAIQCLTEMWDYDFFDVDKGEVLERYKRRMDTSLGPNMGWYSRAFSASYEAGRPSAKSQPPK